MITRSTPTLSLDFFARLVRFYHGLNIAAKTTPIWDGIIDSFYADYRRALEDRSPEKLSQYLYNICRTGHLFGLDYHLDEGFEPFQSTWDWKLRRVAETIGVLPMPNPEQPTDPPPLDGVWPEIEKRFGCPIWSAGGGGMMGFGTVENFVPFTLLEPAAYWTAIERQNGYSKSILEIGAGIGGTPIFFGNLRRVLGRGDYHTIDLPIVSIFQAYFVASTFGENAVSLAGEIPHPDSWFFVHGPDWSGVPEIDLAIIINSMPEFPEAEAKLYLNNIDALMRQGLLYSVNHESGAAGQLIVSRLLEDLHSFRKIQRAEFHPRPGYVEEIWQKR